jgi:hypothetical protein
LDLPFVVCNFQETGFLVKINMATTQQKSLIIDENKHECAMARTLDSLLRCRSSWP